VMGNCPSPPRLSTPCVVGRAKTTAVWNSPSTDPGHSYEQSLRQGRALAQQMTIRETTAELYEGLAMRAREGCETSQSGAMVDREERLAFHPERRWLTAGNAGTN